jgi:hypothetical protein
MRKEKSYAISFALMGLASLIPHITQNRDFDPATRGAEIGRYAENRELFQRPSTYLAERVETQYLEESDDL